MLLEVLKVLEVSGSGGTTSESNPTAEILQELIEVLTSDISNAGTNDNNSEEGYQSDLAQDAASMPLLLQSMVGIFQSSSTSDATAISFYLS
jgi:hypothetical protein